MIERRTVEPANLRIVAEGLKFPEGPVAMADGSVVVVEIPLGRVTRVAPDGTTSVVAETGGGPNGLAVAPDGSLLACNNGGCFDWLEIGELTISGAPPPPIWPGHGSLQRVDIASGEVTTLVTEFEGEPILAPNDLVLDADGGVWFTDFGVRDSMEATPEPSAVYWCRPDGSGLRRAIYPLYGPNGIGLSPDGSRLYVAETYDGRLLAWDVVGPGEVSGTGSDGAQGATLIDQPGGGALFDSLAVDGDGWVCVGTLVGGHGITAYSPDGAIAESTPLADPMVTNICFAPEGGTAYATLSGTGKLVAFDWPRPGGRLHFTA
jgi:gluconolactonase